MDVGECIEAMECIPEWYVVEIDIGGFIPIDMC